MPSLQRIFSTFHRDPGVPDPRSSHEPVPRSHRKRMPLPAHASTNWTRPLLGFRVKKVGPHADPSTNPSTNLPTNTSRLPRSTHERTSPGLLPRDAVLLPQRLRIRKFARRNIPSTRTPCELRNIRARYITRECKYTAFTGAAGFSCIDTLAASAESRVSDRASHGRKPSQPASGLPGFGAWRCASDAQVHG